MKKLSSFLIALGTLTCSTLTFANPVTVHNYYINGMNTNKVDTEKQSMMNFPRKQCVLFENEFIFCFKSGIFLYLFNFDIFKFQIIII